MSERGRYRLALAAVLLLMLAYGVFFSALSIQRHRAFLTHASDLGQIDQAIWNTLQGRLLEHTKATGVQNIRLSDHVEPIFVPLSLAFLVDDSVEALLIVQSFAIAAGALAVFWIARKRFGGMSLPGANLAGVLFAAVYLLFPALQAANLAEFHAVTLAPAPLLFAYYFGADRRWIPFALASLLALAVKEEISLLVLFMAGWFAIGKFEILKSPALPAAGTGRPFSLRILDFEIRISNFQRIPLMLAGLALAWFLLTYLVIIPHFSPLGKSPYTCRYIVDEDCPTVARGLFLGERLGYLGGLLASVGFLALLDPIGLLLGLPLLAANVLSNYPAQYSGTFHYSAPVAPYLVLGAIGGAARLAGWLRARLPARPALVPAALLLPLAIALGYHLAAGYTPAGRGFEWPAVTAHNALFARLAAEIPPGARVSTTGSLNPHLSHRRVLYRFPVVNDADYILLDVGESDKTNPFDFRIAFNDALANGHFGVVDAVDGYVLLKRGVQDANLPNGFYSIFRANGRQPQVPLQIDFGDRLRFLGYDVLTDPYGRAVLQTYWQGLKPLDRNYFLYPFYPDGDGAPRQDVTLPMSLLLWYPPSAWQANEIVVGRTVPAELGAEARVGLAVLDGDQWDAIDKRLSLRLAAPSALPLYDNSTWVELGVLRKVGAQYVMGAGTK